MTAKGRANDTRVEPVTDFYLVEERLGDQVSADVPVLATRPRGEAPRRVLLSMDRGREKRGESSIDRDMRCRSHTRQTIVSTPAYGRSMTVVIF